MTCQELQRRIDYVRLLAEYKADPEGAHAEEDSLYRAFVQMIGENASEPYRTMARMLQTTKDSNFVRQYS